MACKDVEIVFNPSTQRAMVSNQYSIEENISDFFNDISDELTSDIMKEVNMF